MTRHSRILSKRLEGCAQFVVEAGVRLDVAVAARQESLVRLGHAARHDASSDHAFGSAAEHVREHQRPHLVIEVPGVLPVRGLPAGDVDAALRLATGGLVPDLTVVLDIPVDVGRERQRKTRKVQDRFEREDDAFHGRVREAYRARSEERRVGKEGRL